jgi:hypothetical protein
MTEPAVRVLTIAGKRVEIRRVAGRDYFRSSALFLTTFGKSLGGLISGAGLRDADGTPIPWGVLLAALRGAFATEADREAVARLLGGVLARFDDVDPDRLLALSEALILRHVTIGGAEVTTIGTIDALLPEPTAYMQLAMAAIQHNLGPIFAGARTSGVSSAAATSVRPAATPSRRAR